MARILLDDPSRSGGSSQLGIGAALNDGTGDPLRGGGQKLKYWASDLNAMLTEIYQEVVTAYSADTSSATLSRATRCWTGSHNNGQTATVTNIQTLWAAEVGDRFEATKVTATTTGSYGVRPEASGYMGAGAQGKGIVIRDVGTTVKLVCRVAGRWQIDSISGDIDYED